MAFEEPTLFSASVRENVLLGRPDGTDDDVRQALRVAQADFVHELPWGLDTRIGEQGLSLSGGQRQRLALARAVVGRPAVLVLDDPLSALDIHTEAQVEQALRSVLAGTTALVVAHRASTVQLADRVALLVGRPDHRRRHPFRAAAPTVPAYRGPAGQPGGPPGVRAATATRHPAGQPATRPVDIRPTPTSQAEEVRTMTRPARLPPILLEPEADDAWRGVAAEDTEDISAAVGLKLQARSRRLLRSLVRPQRWSRRCWRRPSWCYQRGGRTWSVRWLVAYGIDTAVPALVAGDAGPLVVRHPRPTWGRASPTPRARPCSSGCRPRSRRPCCSICAGGSSPTRRR